MLPPYHPRQSQEIQCLDANVFEVKNVQFNFQIHTYTYVLLYYHLEIEFFQIFLFILFDELGTHNR